MDASWLIFRGVYQRRPGARYGGRMVIVAGGESPASFQAVTLTVDGSRAMGNVYVVVSAGRATDCTMNPRAVADCGVHTTVSPSAPKRAEAMTGAGGRATRWLLTSSER